VRIEVHIDRLVVDGGLGLEGRHAAALREAVAAELARELASRSWWTPLTVRTLRAGTLGMPSPMAPAAAGRAIAAAVSGSLSADRVRR
jgi:hypothetical protein